MKRLTHCLLFIGIFLISACSSGTRFKDLKKLAAEPEGKRISREIASESPMSLGCHTLIEEIIYLKEQREVKEKEKKREAIKALK